VTNTDPLSRVPPQLRPLLSRFRGDVDALMQALLDGRLETEGWLTQMEAAIARYHLAAFMRGAGVTAVPAYTREFLENLVAVQLAFLANFAMVVNAAGSKLQEYRSRFLNRALLYTGAIKVAYWQGDIIRQVGRPLPLPALPAQGTQCGNNCGCRWEIEIKNIESGDFDCFWTRGKDDSCQTCIEREALWNGPNGNRTRPIRIRGGMLQKGNF